MSFIRAFYLENEEAERARDREEQERRQAAPPEELEAEIRQNREKLDRLHEDRLNTHYVWNEEKAAVFRQAAELAYHLAETYHYDIVISEDAQGEDRAGLITLRTYILAYSNRDERMAEAKERFFWLLRTADSVIIDARDDFLMLSFSFDLCDAA